MRNFFYKFSRGILILINGIRHLLKNLNENGLDYFQTSKINQDAQNKLFCQLRSKGGLYDHSIPLNEFYHLGMTK